MSGPAAVSRLEKGAVGADRGEHLDRRLPLVPGIRVRHPGDSPAQREGRVAEVPSHLGHALADRLPADLVAPHARRVEQRGDRPLVLERPRLPRLGAVNAQLVACALQA